ncbi:MAG: tRNA (adenosine(37)-N6)-dimethylallyltransferase MiaA [Gaiellales bacterium]|nr:MAG: tRNA (adenosine(37)-N6)-dimethylallyltransferase MiaA [Gaiellales bacterium]
MRIIAIYGPTAVGKSRVAVAVARALDGEIVSADSMQVYRGIPVITDQPPAELLAAAPHHLVGFLPLDEEYSAARFVEDARVVMEQISGRGRLPVLVGGTGLYIRALLGDFSFAGTDEDARRYWEGYIEENGCRAALARLRELDPAAAAATDHANPRRLVRALEAAAAGVPVTAERERLWSAGLSRDTKSFALELPRDELYARIDERVYAMLSGGAVEEVAAALGGPLSRTASQAIGIAEIKAFLAGRQSLEETAVAIRQKSRNYAKRQLTWMRKMPDIARIDVSGLTPEEAAAQIVNHVRSGNGASST